MFRLFVDYRNNILLTKLSGTIAHDDMPLRNKQAARFVAGHGAMRGIIDWTDASRCVVARSTMIERVYRLPPVLPGQQRIMVAPQQFALALCRMIAAHQVKARGVGPVIVRSLDEALDELHVHRPTFLPVDRLGHRPTMTERVVLGRLAELDAGRFPRQQRRAWRNTLLGLAEDH